MSDENTPPNMPSQHKSWLPDFSAWAREVATKNVMTPLQWILAIVAAACLPGMIFAPDSWIRAGLFLALAGCLIYVLKTYDFFKRTDPDRLQTETFRHAQSELQQTGRLLLDERRRADRGSKLIDATIVSNPSVLNEAIGLPETPDGSEDRA